MIFRAHGLFIDECRHVERPLGFYVEVGGRDTFLLKNLEGYIVRNYRYFKDAAPSSRPRKGKF